jgi:hypothetical protein
MENTMKKLTKQQKIDLLTTTTAFIATGVVPKKLEDVAPDYVWFKDEISSNLFFTVFGTEPLMQNYEQIHFDIFSDENIPLIKPAVDAVKLAMEKSKNNTLIVFNTPFNTVIDDVVGVVISNFQIYK